MLWLVSSWPCKLCVTPSFGVDERLRLLAVVVVLPIAGNLLQCIVQDWILQMKNVHLSDYEIVSKYYESVLEREGHYQEYHYFSKQTELQGMESVRHLGKY